MANDKNDNVKIPYYFVADYFCRVEHAVEKV